MDVYILIEDWAMDGDYDSSYTVFSEMEDTKNEFGTRLEQEKKNGCLSRWEDRDDFEEEITDISYECYEHGDYCKNHYALKIEAQQMVLSEQTVRKIAGEHRSKLLMEDFQSQLEGWEEAHGLTEEQYESLRKDTYFVEEFQRLLDKNEPYWDAYWNLVNEAGQLLLKEYLASVVVMVEKFGEKKYYPLAVNRVQKWLEFFSQATCFLCLTFSRNWKKLENPIDKCPNTDYNKAVQVSEIGHMDELNEECNYAEINRFPAFMKMHCPFLFHQVKHGVMSMSEYIKEQLEQMNQYVKELAAIYHNAASKSGISDNEFWVWYALLVLEGEYSQQDICDMWSLPKQTVNSVISNLAKKEFLLLETVPGTRNRKTIHVTEAGRAYGESIVMPIYQAEQCSLERMPEEDRSMCICLLSKYIRLLSAEINEIG